MTNIETFRCVQLVVMSHLFVYNSKQSALPDNQRYARVQASSSYDK